MALICRNNDMKSALDVIEMATKSMMLDQPDIHIELWVEYASDTIMVGTVNVKKNNGTYIKPLLSRHEIERGSWIPIVGERLNTAVSAVTTSPAVEEYDEIMQAQEIMDDIRESN